MVMSKKFLLAIFSFSALSSIEAFVVQDQGNFWPLPKSYVLYNSSIALKPSLFEFKVVQGDLNKCRILNEAFKRYSKIIGDSLSILLRHGQSNRKYSHHHHHSPRQVLDPTKFLEHLEINFSGLCETLPYFGMNESYRLEVDNQRAPRTAILSSRSVWGILRGLETFTQLLEVSEDGLSLAVRSVSIDDSPRFSHRGLLIDTSRHFLPVDTIKLIIDGMEANKLNVLHWHIVDDQSFPYQSELFPDLSNKGAYDSRLLVYTIADIQAIILYAAVRGVRVMPEFDTPGHTTSWGFGQPGLLTKCYNLVNEYGPVNPINEDNYSFLRDLFNEIIHIFPDGYLHLGGDEVNFDCWASNPEIRKWMANHNMSVDYAKLESFYIQKIVDIVEKEFRTSTIVWQEVFDNGVKLYNSTIVQAWTGNYEKELDLITKAGHKALLSTCWYLDYLETGGDWKKYYKCEPLSFKGTAEQKQLVIGGEACMWGESVDETNVVQRIFPRASAAAEKLWSPQDDFRNIHQVESRLDVHTCRMKRRRIPAQPPNGPGFCLL